MERERRCLWACVPILLLPRTLSAEAVDPYALSLEELSSVRVTSVSSLTEAPLRVQPAMVTQIDGERLERSGASGQLKLMDILVPEMQISTNRAIGHNPAFRGVVPNGPIAHLYLVNGRSMNMNFFLGSWVEANNLMGDIAGIEVVHGPGSVVHGPGALSGVINVSTHDINSYEGMGFTGKKQFINDSNVVEVKYGRRTSEEGGWFFYGGYEEQDGADNSDAPVRYPLSFTAIDGSQVVAGEDSGLRLGHYQESPENDYKLYLDYTQGEFKAWYRYSHESEILHRDRNAVNTDEPDNVVLMPDADVRDLLRNYYAYVYRQQSLQLSNRWPLNDELELTGQLGGDVIDADFDFPLQNGGDRSINHFESEVNARALVNWRFDPAHQLAMGVELFHHWYAFKINGSDTAASPWEVFSYAALAEHQWTLNDQWHSFLGVRLDKGRYSDYLFSPRLALIYTPNERDTWKFIASEAVRFPAQYAARLNAQGGDDTTEEERLKAIELHFQRQHSDELSWQLGAYYQVLDAVDSIQGGSTQGSVGTYDTLGATLVVDYQGEDWDWRLSHSYVDLQDAEDKNGVNPSNISASGQGYGEDLNAWANHNTKFNLIYSPGGAKWSVNTSLNLLWDYPGSEDLAIYNSFLREGGPTPNSPVIDRGYDDAFEAIYQINAGFELRPMDNTRFRLDAYNLYELIDDKHSRYTDRVSAVYRVLPFTLMLTAEYEF